jgi:hypothetical protein
MPKLAKYPIEGGHRRCRECEAVKPLSAYYETRKYGWTWTKCKECVSADHRETVAKKKGR